ncbi:tyrosine-type recombinase/integrase [Phocaeicola massiliensis]|uniref:tyrosine-type recombinase/integrase n=1 Tax=Phocaeicola massiliensis TaxID=204516 RepID=UPI00293D4EFB|nr:tyrosine-type recombinase/integrase [Phocaeicola massiliensis]
MFPKQAANSLVTETLQYFVLFCRSDYHAILVKCLIINDLRLIRTILFFIAFLNITYVARHTFATTVTLANNVPLQEVSAMLGHASTRMTQHYARVMDRNLKDNMNMVRSKMGL